MLSNSVSWFGLLDVTDCPPTADGEEPEQPSQSGGKAKRLPREVKQKLAKVARLAVSCMCSSLFWECLCFYSKHVKTCAK